MSSAFNNESPNYHTPALETPYLKAQQVWDARLGGIHAQMRQWRIIAFALLVLCGLLGVSLMIAVNAPKTSVYVAEVKASGQVVNVTPLSRTYNPEQAQVEYFLSQFIQSIRSLPLDPVVAKQNWLKAYAFLSPRGSALLTSLMRTDNPLNQLGKQTTTVTISSVNPLSPTTYDIDWTETAIGPNGQTLSQKNYAGVFTVSISAPKTESQVLSNPLGIYIDNLHWSSHI